MKDIGFRLYLITDRKLFADRPAFFSAIEEALEGGVAALQLREKDLETRVLLEMAYRLRDLSGRHGAKLFINDRVDIALCVKADGVHLGSSGIPVSAARKVIGKGMLIGASAHSVEEAAQAEHQGADFVTLGPVYETPSKMRYGSPLGTDVLRKAREEISLPIFAIGGIGKTRVADVLESGAHGIALISAILSSRDVRSNTEEFMRLLK
jgi:thiamine-phosphate pyrophosphorylase